MIENEESMIEITKMKTSGAESGNGKSPEKSLPEAIIEFGPPILNLYKEWNQSEMETEKMKMGNRVKLIQMTQEFNFKYTRLVIVIILSMIVISGVLTGMDKIDGSAFTLLLGIIIGYLISMIKSFRPPDPQLIDEDEDY